jgi:alpha-D-ribose 1-methylphosphonate 5-triphosphate synthase subunit PhnH
MRLDPVHDLQAVFRLLMSAMASPGSIRDITPYVEKIDIDAPIAKPMLAIALTLFDAETSFSLCQKQNEFAEAAISRITSARPAKTENADFVLAVEGSSGLSRIITTARSGTLIDPHLGATLIIQSDKLCTGGEIRLTGPGLASEVFIDTGLGNEWLSARAEKNREYPLGIDIIIVDRSGLVTALPRTTVATAEV